jgi:hypothetical protein
MWRLEELAVEARRNLGPAHAVVAALTVVVLGALTALVLLQGHRALTQEAERRAAGSLVWTATAAELTAPLDGTACSRLLTLSGVAVSGGVTASAPQPLHAFPRGIRLPVIGLTPGAAQVFAPTAPWAEVTVGADLARLAEVGPGSWLVDETGARVTQVTTMIDRAPIGVLSSSVTVPAPPDAALEACWIRMHPAAVRHGRDILTTAFPDGSASISPFLRDQAGALTPVQLWQQTTGLRPWLVGGAVIASTLTLLLWTRRTQLAVYRTFGTPRSAMLALVALESALVLLPALAGGLLLGALVHTAATRTGATQQLVTTAASQATAAAVLGLLLTLALSPLATRGALSDTLRDR